MSLNGGFVVVALSAALTVWLVYFVIEVSRQLDVWPF